MQAVRTQDHVISRQEVSPGWVGLYVLTFLLQLPCAAIRALVAYPAVWAVFKLLKQPTGLAHTIAMGVGYGPLVLSVATLILPLGGWWWEQQVGGRSPSERERVVYEDAIAQLKQADPGLRGPRRWFVVDDDGSENAAAYADTVMVTRGLLDSGWLEPVLAHELGHLNSSDARLSAALGRLTTPPRGKTRRGLKTICFFATGAAGMWPLRGAWGAYWRSREHCADQYAARLGQAEALGSFLDERRASIDVPVPFVWMTEHSHPPTEHRVDRLSHPAQQQVRTQAQRTASARAAVAGRSEPVKGTPPGPPSAGPDGLLLDRTMSDPLLGDQVGKADLAKSDLTKGKEGS
jgi:Zn-dependent protease with chaperone function